MTNATIETHADRPRPSSSDALSRWALNVIGATVLLFLCLPILIVVPMSFSSAESLEFPPSGWSLRWFEFFFGDPRWIDAAQTSLLVAAVSSCLAVLLGSAAAYGLVRGSFTGRRFLEANFLIPLILPQIITAVALYIYFAKLGILGTLTGLIIGHTILGLPYVVLLMSVAIRSFDLRIEQVALSLGASWQHMFWRVLMPNLIPSLFAAWVFAFVISFDEVIITIFLSGTHETIPKRMFNELMLQVNPTITAIATLLIGVSVVTISLMALLAKRGGFLEPQR